jgi:hypothetical protein
MFSGGSPWFNEQTGENRTTEEVYKMLFAHQAKGPNTETEIETQETIKVEKTNDDEQAFRSEEDDS